MNKPLWYITVLCIFICNQLSAQTVGVVLSGGGASGMAHVGVLKALEENNIPIDYIVGTSAGALVASLYASGYSPNEIDSLLISKEFLLMAEGKLNTKDKFLLKNPPEDAAIVNLKFDKHLNGQSVIPANYIYPNYLDFSLLNIYGDIQGLNHDFDSMFVPFRSVSSDVEINQAYVFRNGNINEAVRTSMTYPFYMKPIRVDGRLMYDGGLYNNFPSDVLYDDFLPDVIIGCNLSDSSSAQGDDFFSQLKTVVLNRANNTIKCENGIVLKPKSNLGTFDFAHSYEALIDGYKETIFWMDSIKSLVQKRSNPEELNQKRVRYKNNINSVISIDSIIVSNNVTLKQKQFIERSLLKEKETISLLELKKRFFRLVNDQMISHIFPRLIRNETTDNYILQLDVSLDKAFELSAGGIFSSSPINTGFIGINYKRLGKTSSMLRLNSYFGKLYGSVKGEYNIDFSHSKTPTRLGIEAGINRYDYFKSYATFFEDVKPSFIVENEYYSGVNFNFPSSNNSRIKLYYNNFYTNYKYYQIENFGLSDTTDVVTFFGNKYGLNFTSNTLNKKYFPTSGRLISIDGYYIKGEESNTPGSTSIQEEPFTGKREWFKMHLDFNNYFSFSKNFSFGVSSSITASSNYEFSNYFSTLLYSSQFRGIPQMNTIYSADLRSNNFLSIGLEPILIIKEELQFRNELIGFSPIISIRKNQINQTTQLNKIFLTQYFIAKSSIVYTSPFGPISLSLIYLQPEEKPLFFQFNFGFIIHNKRILD